MAVGDFVRSVVLDPREQQMQRAAKGGQPCAGAVEQQAAGDAQTCGDLPRHALHFDGTHAAGFLFDGNDVEGEHDVSL